jgi:hypothetical protein
MIDGLATLLGLDPQREACLACVHLHGDSTGEKTTSAASVLDPLSDDILQASTVSDQETAYPDILGIHQAGSAAGNRSVDALPALNILKNMPAGWIGLVPPDIPGRRIMPTS